MRSSSTGIVLVAAGLLLAGAAGAAAQQEPGSTDASLRIGGRLQPQLAHSSVGEGPGLEVFLRRARLTFDVVVNEWLSGRFEPDIASGGVADAWVRLTLESGHRISMGRFKRSFDLFELQSSADINVVERDGRVPGFEPCAGLEGVCTLHRFSSALGFSGRDVGIRVDGRIVPGISYEAALTNGTGSLRGDENDAKSGSGRVLMELSEELRLGANLSVHDYQDPGGLNRFASAWGLDLELGEYEREGVHVQAGLIGGDNWRIPDADGEPSNFSAVQAIVSSYRSWDTGPFTALEPLGRISWAGQETPAGDQGGVLLTPGVVLHVARRNKISTNIDVYAPDDGPTEWSLKIQSYLYF